MSETGTCPMTSDAPPAARGDGSDGHPRAFGSERIEGPGAGLAWARETPSPDLSPCPVGSGAPSSRKPEAKVHPIANVDSAPHLGEPTKGMGIRDRQSASELEAERSRTAHQPQGPLRRRDRAQSGATAGDGSRWRAARRPS